MYFRIHPRQAKRSSNTTSAYNSLPGKTKLHAHTEQTGPKQTWLSTQSQPTLNNQLYHLRWEN